MDPIFLGKFLGNFLDNIFRDSKKFFLGIEGPRKIQKIPENPPNPTKNKIHKNHRNILSNEDFGLLPNDETSVMTSDEPGRLQTTSLRNP